MPLRHSRPILLARSLAAAGLALALSPVLAAAPDDEASRGNQAIPPAQSLEKLQTSPELDLRVDLVAHEPQVVDPVAIAFDERSRMFVVEMRDYPRGPSQGETPRSRIRLLEDTDDDGTYDTADTYADQLLFPTGVLPWKGGLIVTLAGEVRYLKDTDGDNRADTSATWFKGFAQKNSQLRANHPTLGPDGWIYIANGLRGGKVTTVHPDWPKKTLNIRNADFRFNPHTGEAQVVSGGSQFGLAFDSWGNRFICSNRNPCDQVMLEDHEVNRNPALAVGKPVEVVVPAGNDSRVFPLTDAWTTSTQHAGQFTAACAVNIFDGNALPDECVGNVFTCEPTGSLLHREILTPAGGTFKATPGVEGVEFLASTDSWFRPVNTTIGPDGALYVVDMYRAVIEHPQWMPSELKNRRDMRWGDEHGRIYRLAVKGNAPQPRPTLDPDNPEELDAALKSDNGWLRKTASRLLWERTAQLKLATLRKILETAKLPESRLRAIQLAVSIPDADPTEMLVAGLNDDDPRLVAGTVVAAKSVLRNQSGEIPRISEELRKLASSDDGAVRFEVARALGELEPNKEGTAALATIAARDANRRWSRAAVLTSVQDPLALYDSVVTKESDGAVPFLSELAEFIGRRKKTKEATGLLERLSTTGPESGWATPILLGLARGMGGSLQPAIAKLDEKPRGRLEALFSWAASVAADESALAEQRATLISLVGVGSRSHALPVLLDLMETVKTPSIRAAVAQALGNFRDDERITPALLEDFSSRPPAVRSAVLDAILADPARAIELLKAVQEEIVSVAELGPTRIAALRKHQDKTVRQLAKKLFAPPADRQNVLDKYADAARMDGDSQAGRAIFEKNCATCHRIGDLGTQVGPDIADSRTRTPQAIMTDVLDPNRAIDGQYMAYSVVLTDGTVQTGIISSETSGSVTLTQPDGKTLTIPRDEILEMHSDGVSLMPVGIERTISPEQMTDLISFIKNWRYLDGEVPLGKASP